MFSFILEIQILVTVKITVNNLNFFLFFYNSANIEFEKLIFIRIQHDFLRKQVFFFRAF
jgi:hypothetical protein